MKSVRVLNSDDPEKRIVRCTACNGMVIVPKGLARGTAAIHTASASHQRTLRHIRRALAAQR